MTPTHTESAIELDLGAAQRVIKHDDINHVFKGVDFLIEEAASDIWLEIKNCDLRNAPAHVRTPMRQKFLRRLKSKRFWRDELLLKFLGTSAFLYHEGGRRRRGVVYVILLEPRIKKSLLLHVQRELTAGMQANDLPMPVGILVVDHAGWNSFFPHLPCQPQP